MNKTYTLPIILVTCLFFLWGLAYGLLDFLKQQFPQTLHVTKQRSAHLQGAYFGLCFLIALPSESPMQKMGYKKGIIRIQIKPKL